MAGGVLTFLVEAGPVLLLGLGAWRVTRGDLSLGTVIAFISFIHYLYGLAQSLILTKLGLQRAQVAASRILEILDEAPEPSGKAALTIHSGRLDVEGVSFTYPNGTAALRGASLSVEPGTWVALVGRTGSGRSTLLSLLVGLYKPSQGTIRIDGQDLQEADLASLRKQALLVTQDVFLFSTTVMENLRCGDPAISEEEVLRVTQALGAQEFILGLPEGYGTPIGERGVRNRGPGFEGFGGAHAGEDGNCGGPSPGHSSRGRPDFRAEGWAGSGGWDP
ncbi:MAG: ATP-binding cassette domain-containing protein [Candidatus Bipolaricaulaceae bacterium]